MIEITRRFEVPAGHRLFGHEGACRYLHGHNYVLFVTLSASELDSNGRVVDFSRVKKIIGGWLEENWDHCMLVNEVDETVVELARQKTMLFSGKLYDLGLFKKLYLFKGNPTAELMARELHVVVRGLMEKEGLEVDVVKVRCQETENCWAECSPEGDVTEFNPDEE